MADVVKIERVILGLDPFNLAADADINGIIDMGDVVKIERVILGLDSLSGNSPSGGKSSSGKSGSGGKTLDSVATVNIDAPSQVLSCSDFTVNVNTTQITSLDADNFDITFDPAIIRLDNTTSGLDWLDYDADRWV